MVITPAFSARPGVVLASDDQPSPTGDGRRPEGRGPGAGVGGVWFLVAAIGVGVALGWWLDSRYATRPWWTLGCSLAFMAVGFYHLIRDSRR